MQQCQKCQKFLKCLKCLKFLKCLKHLKHSNSDFVTSRKLLYKLQYATMLILMVGRLQIILQQYALVLIFPGQCFSLSHRNFVLTFCAGIVDSSIGPTKSSHFVVTSDDINHLKSSYFFVTSLRYFLVGRRCEAAKVLLQQI